MQDKWYTYDIDKVIDSLKSNKDGLTNEEAVTRLEKNGLNKLETAKKRNIIFKFLDQFKSFTIIILIIAAVISLIIGIINNEGIIDSIVIFVVVLLNAIIGVIEEENASKSVESLAKLSCHVCKVKRSNEILVIPSTDLVVGDIVLLECGDYVSADMRVLSSNDLKTLESSLTGESDAILKTIEVLDEKTPLAERTNMLYSSSLIVYGRGSAIVTNTGMDTEVGKIAALLNNEDSPKTPLQEKLDNVGRVLGLVAIAICVVLFITGVLLGRSIMDMFMTSVSLGVAAIPEGLVAVSTIVLSIGVRNMVKKKVIIRKLYSVETLGSVNVICTDKTGTLTQNKMKVVEWFCNDKYNDEDSLEFLYLMENCILCNDIDILDDGTCVGDPTEEALYNIAIEKIKDGKKLLDLKCIDEIPFDSDRKLMSVVYKIDNKYIYFVKGSPSELIKRCNKYMFDSKTYDINEYSDIILSNNDHMASKALRVLGFAIKKTDVLLPKEEMEKDLTFVGLVGMMDPPRESVKEAILKCKNAGIKTVMITGDQKTTAIAIAKELGILKNVNEAVDGNYLDTISDEELIVNVEKYSVYSRVLPEHKMRIVNAWQKRNNIVAMTGDGVNDSPALKKANIGCSMGVVGTEVAKEASDLILADDNFSTIVCAVEEGRRIYSNILKVIQFLISSNIGEIVAIFIGTMLFPIMFNMYGIKITNNFDILLPIHILWINLITDSIPAFALSFDPPASDIMNKKPIDNKEGIFNKGMVIRIMYQGFIIGLTTLLAFILGFVLCNDTYEQKIMVAQTMAFATISFIELIHVFNVRSNTKSLIKGFSSNKKLLLSTLISLVIVLIVLYVPFLRNLFSLAHLSLTNLTIVILLSLVPSFIVELLKIFRINDIK